MNINTDKIKIIGLGAGSVGLLAAIFIFLNNKDTIKTIEQDSFNHNVLTYTQNEDISIFNSKNKQYLNTIKVNSQKRLDDEGYKNFFNIESYNDKFFAASTSKELNLISIDNDELKIKKTFKVNGVIENFKVLDQKIYLQYNNSSTIDILDANTGNKLNSIELKSKATNIHVDDKFIYACTEDSIFFINKKDLSVNKESNVFIGSKATSIISNGKYLFVGTDFGTDKGSSMLIKIDIKAKNVENILELKKEYPVSMFEKGDFIYVLCRGILDNELDGIIVVNKNSLTKKTTISTGKNPNSMFYTEDGFIYVSHEDGSVISINAKNNFTQELNTTISGVKEITLINSIKE